jgi:hypothetical protein
LKKHSLQIAFPVLGLFIIPLAVSQVEHRTIFSPWFIGILANLCSLELLIHMQNHLKRLLVNLRLI